MERICLQCRRPQFEFGVGKIPWRRERLPTPVFWPGEFCGLYSRWGCKESNTTDRLSFCIKQVYQHHFPNSICSLHVSVQHFGNSHSISSFFLAITIFVMGSVISDLRCSYCNCFGVPQVTTILRQRT